jgi:hypothetical protein
MFTPEDKKEIDKTIKRHLSIFVKLINRKARLSSEYLIKMSDKIFAFNTKNDNKHIFSYWSIDTFVRSWLLSLIYLVMMFFVVGYVDLDKSILWQFVFLFVIYILIFYIKFSKNISTFEKIVFYMILFMGEKVGVFEGIITTTGFVAGLFAGFFAGFFVYLHSAATVLIAAMITILFAFMFTNDNIILTQNIFQLLPTLKNISQNDMLGSLAVFFFIMPISNALIDSLSLSVSRYEFQKLLNKTKYSFSFFLKISLVDFFYALISKLLVLFVFYYSKILVVHFK